MITESIHADRHHRVMEAIAVCDELTRKKFGEPIINRTYRSMVMHDELTAMVRTLAEYAHDVIDETPIQESVRKLLLEAERVA